MTFPGSTTGIYMTTKLFPQLGIASTISGRITNTGVAAVASGESEIAIQPVSELLHAPGVDFAGTIPAEIQFMSVFSTAVVAGSKELEASKRLIRVPCIGKTQRRRSTRPGWSRWETEVRMNPRRADCSAGRARVLKWLTAGEDLSTGTSLKTGNSFERWR